MAKAVTVRVLGVTFEVVRDAFIAPERQNTGEFRPERQQLAVSANAKAECQGEVLLHEVFEALYVANQLDADHQTMSTLSRSLYAVMRDNPKLVEKIARGRRVL